MSAWLGTHRLILPHGGVVLDSIARTHDSTVARIALAWVQARPGVTSPIIGARRIAQLEDNVQAIDVRPSVDEFAAIRSGGTTVNGLFAPTSGFGIEKGEQPY